MTSNGVSPRVSVIITTFRRPAYLKKAVASVLGQDFGNFELIIVNDGPADAETDAVVSSFRDDRIKYLRNGENLGGAKSLNIGLGAATGKYIAILDDDDEWICGDKLSRQVGFLEKRADYVLVGTRMVVVNYADDKEIVRPEVPEDDKELRKRMLTANPFAHSSILYPREVALSLGGYDSSLLRGKDLDLILRLGKKGKVAVLPDYCLKYREASNKERNIIVARLRDAKATLKVVWRYKQSYPRGFSALVVQVFRVFVFSILWVIILPRLWRA